MSRGGPAGELSWWSLRAHWLLGILLLALFTGASWWALVPAVAAWAAGTWMDWVGTPRETLSRLGAPIVAFFLATAIADLLFIGRDLLASVSFLILGTQAVRLLLPKGVREGWQLCAIALLEFLVAATASEGLSLALFAFLFLTLSAGAMWSLHGQEAEELGRPSGGWSPSPRVAAWSLLLVGISGFLGSALLFTVVPRLEFRRGLQRFSRGQAVSGFSDTITLREVTGIKADRSVVARVEFPFLVRTPDSGGLYLRGAVYSMYSNGVWRPLRTPLFPIPRAGFHHLVRDAPRGAPAVADITLEPADHPRLFTYGHPFLIEGAFGPLFADAEGGLFFPQPGHPTLRYRIRFVEALPPRVGAFADPGERYLEFPERHEDVRALGIEVAGASGTDADRADRLLAFFRKGFRYTLADPPSSIRRFLFERKAGHCEHYATGLALLLRAGGIPSRVAVGYLGGEWNAVGRYLIVRQSDAHAWVEAWIDGRWVTLDATPAQGEESPFFRKTGPLGLYVDWMRQRWDKYVLNYSLRMQAEAVSAGWSGVRRTGRVLGFGKGIPGAAPIRLAAALILPACAALYLLFRWKRRRASLTGGGRIARLPTPYERLLRRLERSGFRASPGAPMEEIVAAAVRSRPELSEEAGRFLDLYHRDRFGPSPLPPELRSESFRRADRLRKRLS